MVASFSISRFTAKFELVFALTHRAFILNATERALVLLKNGTRDF